MKKVLILILVVSSFLYSEVTSAESEYSALVLQEKVVQGDISTMATSSFVNATNYKSTILIDGRWGNAQDEFGLRIGEKGQEIEPLGPLTFTVDTEGNIYVFDTVNRQVKKFNKKGVYVKTILSNVYGTAIYTDTENLYLLNGHTIMQYSKDGILIDTYEISKDIDLIEGYGQGIFCDREGNLCINRIQTVYSIATPIKIEQERGQKISSFKSLKPNEQKENKKWGMMGRKPNDNFAVKWLDNHRAAIKILDDKRAVSKEILMETPDSFGGVLFLGQDNQDAIYIEAERITSDNYVHLEVQKYNLKGTLLVKIELPNDYFTTTYKKIHIDNHGNIYHLLTTPGGVKVIKWQQTLKKGDR